MIKICISGLTGSGKTTLGKILSKELKIPHITKEQTKTYSSILEELKRKNNKVLQLRQTADPKYAKTFDKEIIRAASGKNCVVTTWLGPWLIKDATLRVWLNASLKERAKRKSKDLGISVRAAKKYVIEKDIYASKAFMKIYNININDHSIFDMEINTEKLNHKMVVAIISMLSITKGKLKYY